jgi:hypothetical protein
MNIDDRMCGRDLLELRASRSADFDHNRQNDHARIG